MRGFSGKYSSNLAVPPIWSNDHIEHHQTVPQFWSGLVRNTLGLDAGEAIDLADTLNRIDADERLTFPAFVYSHQRLVVVVLAVVIEIRVSRFHVIRHAIAVDIGLTLGGRGKCERFRPIRPLGITVPSVFNLSAPVIKLITAQRSVRHEKADQIVVGPALSIVTSRISCSKPPSKRPATAWRHGRRLRPGP